MNRDNLGKNTPKRINNSVSWSHCRYNDLNKYKSASYSLLETIPFIDECDESSASLREADEIRTVSAHVDESKSDDEMDGQNIFTFYEQQTTNNYLEIKENRKRRLKKANFHYSIGK